VAALIIILRIVAGQRQISLYFRHFVCLKPLIVTALLSIMSRINVWLLIVALVGAVSASLEIRVTSKPRDCDSSIQAASGDVVTLHYMGKFRTSGEIFDSTHDREEPLTFKLGEDEMIDGFEQGIIGMCAGEKRVVTVPPELGYGDEEEEMIPAGSTLVFTIHMLEIQREPLTDRLWRYFFAFIRVGVPILAGVGVMWFLIKKYSGGDQMSSRQRPRNPFSKTQLKREARSKPPLAPLGD